MNVACFISAPLHSLTLQNWPATLVLDKGNLSDRREVPPRAQAHDHDQQTHAQCRLDVGRVESDMTLRLM